MSGVIREQSTFVRQPDKNTLKSYMTKGMLLNGNCSKSPIKTNKNTDSDGKQCLHFPFTVDKQ